ncbi:hypothetical protein CRUP_022158 [Coryphaenoides rupestris]|nr:hypothetical protein CRUP_022158 [Coryphaenoides rupestris]
MTEVFPKGLSMVTMCFSPGLGVLVYLCHLCEETCPQEAITGHLFSRAHCVNYYNYTDPDVLSFSWLPSMNLMRILWPLAMRDMKTGAFEVLQVLDLPHDLFNTIKILPYASGLQHLVECVCDVARFKRFYLCTLCQITLRGNGIISHSTWHPSTLMSKNCYTDYRDHVEATMANYAKQVEDRIGTDNKIKGRTGDFGSGLLFVVVCVCSEASLPALYTCFACRTSFQDTYAWKHLTSQEHALYTTMRQNIPFAWDYRMDIRELRELALKEQQANGGHVLKVDVLSGGPRVQSGGPRVQSGGPRVQSGGPRVPSGGPRVP